MNLVGIPNDSTFKQYDQLAHLFARIEFGSTCKLSPLEAGTLYYLSNQLGKSIHKILSSKVKHQLKILKDSLARIYA